MTWKRNRAIDAIAQHCKGITWVVQNKRIRAVRWKIKFSTGFAQGFTGKLEDFGTPEPNPIRQNHMEKNAMKW